MIKTLTLETISYKQRRAKFANDTWLTLSPMINMDGLKFGTDYELNIVMDNNNLWYVEDMKVKENAGK